MSTPGAQLAAPIDRTIRLTLLPKNQAASAVAAYVASYLPQTQTPPFPQIVNSFNPVLTLVGPASIEGGFTAGLGDDSGIGANRLQPWFIRNVPITIKGESYLGMYPLLSNPDLDFQSMLQLFNQAASQFAPRSGTPGTGQKFMLSISGYPLGARRFTGHVEALLFTEAIQRVNMVGYTLKFKGVPSDQVALQQGALAAKGLAFV